MKNYLNIAKRFADKHGFDIVKTCAERNGFSYFHLDFSGRTRYTGHPHIIKISTTGKVLVVADINEIYWAVKKATTPEQ